MKVAEYPLKKVNSHNNTHTFYKIQFRDPITGKSTTKRGFQTKREAKQYYIEEMAKRQKSSITGNTRLTFNEVAKKWLDNKRHIVRGSTYRKCEGDYRNHLLNAFGNKKMTDVTLEECQQLVFDYADKYQRWDKKISVFSSVFKFAIRYGIVTVNPFDRVERPKVKHVDHKGYTPEQFTIFKRGIIEHYKETNPKAFTVLWLLAHTGLRKGEALGLRWSDVDLSAGFIHVRVALTRDYDNKLIEGDQPKNKYSIRTVPIGSGTIKVLKKWRIEQRHELKYYNINTSQPNQLVFTSQHGGPLSPSKPGKWKKVIEKKYGLPHNRIHDLRHTYTTLLAYNGEPVTEIAGVLGHSSPTITNQVYTDIHKVENHHLSDDIEKY